MINTIQGSCLCEEVKFEVENDFTRFYQCHCKQCQQITGSAFAANIFTKPTNIKWLSGELKVKYYHHPTRSFTKAFCINCGCGVPFVTQNKKALIIPAGSLLTSVDITPQANIFTSETAHWLHDGMSASKFKQFPE